MTVDRKTGLIDLQLGETPVQLQITYREIAAIERATGKGAWEYANEIYYKAASVSELAKVLSITAVSPKFTEAEWGEFVWNNRAQMVQDTFWIDFVLDFCSVIFDVDTRNPPEVTEQQKKDGDQPDQTGSISSETPTTSASDPASSGH